MKTIITLAIASILLVGCSIPKNPKLSWGKKCTVQGNQVVWSHLWIYDKNEGLDATKENFKAAEQAKSPKRKFLAEKSPFEPNENCLLYTSPSPRD